MKKKIIITGAAGLIGSRLANWIADNQPDYHIIAIDNLSGGYIENLNTEHENITFYEVDCLDTHKMDILFKTKPEYVYHLAAYAAEGLSPFIRKYNYTNNLVATAQVVNLCIKYDIKRLVFTSTMAVYGHGDAVWRTLGEDLIPNPIDPYGVAKYACETDIQIAGEQHGLDWCIIRPHNVYGINQNIWDKYRNVLGIWMYQYMNGEPITIFGDGTQTRAFSFIDDSLEPLWNAAVLPEASKEIINLGGTKPYTINEAAKTISRVIGSKDILYLEGRHEVHTAEPTFQKSIDILKFEDKTSLEEGLQQMWNWAQTQPKRERFVWNEYELDKGIYSFWKKK